MLGRCCASFCGDASGDPGALCRSLSYDVELFSYNFTNVTQAPMLFGLPETSGNTGDQSGPAYFSVRIDCDPPCRFRLTLELWHSGDSNGEPPTETWTGYIPIDCDGCPAVGPVDITADAPGEESASIITMEILACE